MGLAWCRGAAGNKAGLVSGLRRTTDDVAHRIRVGKGLEYELRGAALVHREAIRSVRCAGLRGAKGWCG